VKFGVVLGQTHPSLWRDAARVADECGYESVWLSEHLVLPTEMAGQLVPGEEHPPIDPHTPVFDVAAYLGYLAGITEHTRLGSFVYLLAIRHPFVGARAFATLDVISDGRAELGVGAGWMTSEWRAAGLDPKGRGRRLDEAIHVTRRLWSERVVAHDGEFWAFPEVGFEPKPLQAGGVPIGIGGESPAALSRAARLGDWWLGMQHTPQSAAAAVAAIRATEAGQGRGGACQISVMGSVSGLADIEAYAAAGVDRLMVVPWTRVRETVAALRDFAATFIGRSRGEP
jgi:probable F420-dependent oxidoreductase